MTATTPDGATLQAFPTAAVGGILKTVGSGGGQHGSQGMDTQRPEPDVNGAPTGRNRTAIGQNRKQEGRAGSGLVLLRPVQPDTPALDHFQVVNVDRAFSQPAPQPFHQGGHRFV